MKLLTLVILALVGLFCPEARGQVACPWLTAGTAASVLGGTPELAVKLGSPQEGSCVFTFQNEARQSTLVITVEKQPPSSPELSCPTGSASLVGIGNRAALCHPAFASRGEKLLVLGQVRGAYFSIVLTATRKYDGIPAAASPEDAITMIAEQVAGSLF